MSSATSPPSGWTDRAVELEANRDLEKQEAHDAVPGSETGSEKGHDPDGFKFFRLDRRTISDAILGLADGLTVPFALTAGLSHLGTTKVVILGGLAEMVAGAISMGLGGFLGARSELESYNATLNSTRHGIEMSAAEACIPVEELFRRYQLPPTTVSSMVQNLQSCPERLLDFLMVFHHQESMPTMKAAYKTAITLALSYFIGGLVPLIPYFIVPPSAVLTALWWSSGIMGITLLVFGYVKTCVVIGWTGRKNFLKGVKGGVQMLLVGAAAAGAAVGLVKAIEQGGLF